MLSFGVWIAKSKRYDTVSAYLNFLSSFDKKVIK